MMFRAMVGLPPGGTTPKSDVGPFVKTHSFRPAGFSNVRRAVFIFGDPVAAVLSTRKHRYTEQHFRNCGANDLSPETTDIFVNDALNYEYMFDAWMGRQNFDLICVRYEELHDNIEAITAFFGRHLYIPPRRPRRTRPELESADAQRIAATYARLIEKVNKAPDVAVYRAAGQGALSGSTAPAPSVHTSGTECPICGGRDTFVAFRGRPHEQCSSCKSLVRTRAMYLVLRHLDRLPSRGALRRCRIAHFAPERALYKALTRAPESVSYAAFDIEPERYRFAKSAIRYADICELDKYVDSGTYDLVLHNHVLEHAPCALDYATRQLQRLLAPGGIHLFSVPMRRGYYRENLDRSLPQDVRRAEFAQEDHMRIFGQFDVEDQFRRLFGAHEVVMRLSDFLSRDDARRSGVESNFQNESDGKIDGSSIFFAKT